MVRRGAQRHVKRGRGSGAAADVHDDGDDDGDVTVELPRFVARGWMDRWVKSHHTGFFYDFPWEINGTDFLWDLFLELDFLWFIFWTLIFHGIFFFLELYMGFPARHGGTPIAGSKWLVYRGKSQSKVGDEQLDSGTPISGNLHMEIWEIWNLIWYGSNQHWIF